MTHAFAKDSHSCAVCVSWGGERRVSDDNALVHVERYSVSGECRAAVSQDYHKATRSYHTCPVWSPLPVLKAHGARPQRQPITSMPIPAAAMKPAPSPAPAARPAPAPAPVPAVEPDSLRCRSTPLDIEQTPPPARVLFSYWHRLKKQRPMPAAHEMDTAQLRDCVSRLSLMAPAPDGDDFIYRSCGRAVQRRLAVRAVCRRVRDLHPAEAAERWLADLRACFTEGVVKSHLVRNDPLLPGNRYVEVLLPLADARGNTVFVLAYRHLPGG